MDPTSRRSTFPVYALASTTQTPLAATKMWSVFPRVPGIKRSCRGITMSPTSRATNEASRLSPKLPFSQLAATSREAISSATSAAKSPYCLRTSSTRLFLRRRPSAAADAPAVPGSVSPALGAHARHVAFRSARLQYASAPFDSAMPQSAHTPGTASGGAEDRGRARVVTPTVDSIGRGLSSCRARGGVGEKWPDRASRWWQPRSVGGAVASSLRTLSGVCRPFGDPSGPRRTMTLRDGPG